MPRRLSDVPGAPESAARWADFYSDRAKVKLINVTAALISQHGAVSEPVARAMAEGTRARASSDVGVGVTGIAGPGGGTAEKPVGTVAIAVATRHDARVRTFRFFGGREMVKF